VPAVTHEGRLYEIPHFNNPCGQNGGCVVARDAASGTQIWALKVYCTPYDLQLETDVQDVFITSLAVQNGQLVVKNERNLEFAIDLGTRAVSGGPNGCDEAQGDGTGCTYAQSTAPPQFSLSAALLALAIISTRWRRRASAQRNAAS
jgi:hypothetical protein